MAVALIHFEQDEREMGHCPTIRHESLKNDPFCFSTLVVVLSIQSSKMASCTSCLIWPHGWSHASKPSTFATIGASSKNLSLMLGEHKNYQEPFWSMLHLWSFLFGSPQPIKLALHVSGWKHLPKMSSLQCSCPNQASPITSLAWVRADKEVCPKQLFPISRLFLIGKSCFSQTSLSNHGLQVKWISSWHRTQTKVGILVLAKSRPLLGTSADASDNIWTLKPSRVLPGLFLRYPVVCRGSWDETGWWGWGTILEDGELYWLGLVGRHRLWRDLFLGGNIGSSRIGNSFKTEHWARKISSSE